MLRRFVLCASILCFLLMYLSAQEKEIVEGDWNDLKWERIEGNEVSIFVDFSLNSKQKGLGTEKKPFKTIDEAFSYISLLNTRKKIKVILYIRGNFLSSYSYVVSFPLKIIGHTKKEKTKIEFRKNAGFVLSSSFLALENISVFRREVINEPRTVPLFYISSGKLSLKDVSIEVKEGGSIFNFKDSKFYMNGVSIKSKQKDYCNIVESATSQGRISLSKIVCISKSTIAFDVKKSDLFINNTSYEVTSSYFSFFIRSFNSKIDILNSALNEKNKSDVAIIHNKASRLKVDNVKLSGFVKSSEVRNGKLDYIK